MSELWSRIARDKADAKTKARLFQKGRIARAHARRGLLRVIHLAIEDLRYGNFNQDILTIIIHSSAGAQWGPSPVATTNCLLRHKKMWDSLPTFNNEIYARCRVCDRLWRATASVPYARWLCVGSK